MTTRHEAIAAGNGHASRIATAAAARQKWQDSDPNAAARDATPRADRLAALMGEDSIVTTIEAAAMLGVSVGTLETWRSQGEGPSYIRVNRRARGYRLGALRAWVRSCETPQRER